MAKITYQVEYMSRPDDRDHVVPFGEEFRKARSFARKMSNLHDGSAYVVAVSETERDGQTVTEAVGHVIYVFGVRDGSEGTIKLAA